jgi:hypothetical protein
MQTERRAEKRHVISYLFATIENSEGRYSVNDIGRANARLDADPDRFHPGRLYRITFHLPVFAGRTVAVPVKGTVARVGPGEVAVTYDPPTGTWWRILDSLARYPLALA